MWLWMSIKPGATNKPFASITSDPSIGSVEIISMEPLFMPIKRTRIGRPSTYAPTISTIQKRGYVVKEAREVVERKYKVISLDGIGAPIETSILFITCVL